MTVIHPLERMLVDKLPSQRPLNPGRQVNRMKTRSANIPGQSRSWNFSPAAAIFSGGADR
jgi:hypothetical protein